jgi:hypothetical protein
MRSGQVSTIQELQRRKAEAAPAASGEAELPQPREPHHWHLSDLLHPFHRKQQ